MFAITRHKHDALTLVERAQPNPVFCVERLLAHRHQLPLVSLGVLDRRRRIRPEPRALLGHDCDVALEEHQHEGFELREARCVRPVPRSGHFVVDRGEEEIRGEVLG